MYDELVKRLRNCTSDTVEGCAGCPYQGGYKGTYCMNGLITEAADAIEELSKPKWIPVTERLPRRHKNVLCCGARGGMFVGWFTNISAISDNKAIAYVHGGNGRYVTHWMPLPSTEGLNET